MAVNGKTLRTDFVRFPKKDVSQLKKRFQKKYLSVIATFVSVCLFAFIVPLFFFLNQNYEIFLGLAYKNSPDLIEHLLQEKLWMQKYLVIAFITAMVFTLLFTRGLTQRIIGPLLVLQAHIKTLTRGNWAENDLKVRDDDEFHELIKNYNYFCSSLKRATKHEIEILEEYYSLKPDPRLLELIDKKYEQIGEVKSAPIDFSAKSEPSHDSRHVS